MPRILGVDIPNNKHVNVSLTYIYGIGPSVANEICRRAQIDPMLKAGDLSESNIAAILQVLQESFLVEGDLRRQVAQNIRRLIAIGSYRGLRHRRNLPARGQRTKTNARTRKGGKKTIGAIRDKSARKQAGK
ncbi:MAG: 30S ribosomal protein S13 [Lentisphaeria bacterium]|jgi:small subunit ribosomal protein S13|nr:30S ribosomal protein S13 [Lentisphaeria bacterium]MDY0175880.1 30S ribosomal protein S13 [Lentisphaeria bacterium]NLZ59669.1 30S ribosomal protein S13 [Lentisphaerota bacterium]